MRRTPGVLIQKREERPLPPRKLCRLDLRATDGAIRGSTARGACEPHARGEPTDERQATSGAEPAVRPEAAERRRATALIVASRAEWVGAWRCHGTVHGAVCVSATVDDPVCPVASSRGDASEEAKRRREL